MVCQSNVAQSEVRRANSEGCSDVRCVDVEPVCAFFAVPPQLVRRQGLLALSPGARAPSAGLLMHLCLTQHRQDAGDSWQIGPSYQARVCVASHTWPYSNSVFVFGGGNSNRFNRRAVGCRYI